MRIVKHSARMAPDSPPFPRFPLPRPRAHERHFAAPAPAPPRRARRPPPPSAVSGGEFEPRIDPAVAAQQLTVLGVTLGAGAYWWRVRPPSCARPPPVLQTPPTD